MEREQAQRTAIQTMRQEQEQSASLATLTPIWADVTRAHATSQYETTLQSLLTADEWQRYEHDPERGTPSPGYCAPPTWPAMTSRTCCTA